MANRIHWLQAQAQNSYCRGDDNLAVECRKRAIALLEEVGTEESLQSALDERMRLGEMRAGLIETDSTVAEEQMGHYAIVAQRCRKQIEGRRDPDPRPCALLALARIRMAIIRNKQGRGGETARWAEEALDVLLTTGPWRPQLRCELRMAAYALAGDGLRRAGAAPVAALKHYEQAIACCRHYIESGYAMGDEVKIFSWDKPEWEKEPWKTADEDPWPWRECGQFDVVEMFRWIRGSLAEMAAVPANESTRQFIQRLEAEIDGWGIPRLPEAGPDNKS